MIGSSSRSDDPRIRASALCSSFEPIRLTKRGIPEYIGGDSLRSVLTIDTTCTTTTGPVDGSSASYAQDFAELHDESHISDEAGCHQLRQNSALHLQKGNHTTDDDLKPSPSPFVWKIDTSLLPSLPQHAPIERSSLRVRDIPLDRITARISNFLRVNSISSCYSSEEPGRVDCLTCNCIKFVIQLWKDEDGSFVVEVQRRRGCGIRMRHLRNCLCKTIVSGEQCHCHQNCCEIQLPRPSKGLEEKICNELLCKERQNQEQSKRRRASDGQLACLDLLESDKLDEKRLGIECLLGMTDPKSGSGIEVARALVYNEGAIALRLRQAFLDFLSAKLCTSEVDGDWSSKDASVRTGRTVSTVEDASMFEILAPPPRTDVTDAHVLALTALVNCLELMDVHEQDYLTNESIKLQLWSPFWCRVLEVLVYNLHESSSQPLEAALSAKCIRILESLEPERISTFIGTVVAPLLKPAHEFGKAHHWSLEKESQDLVVRYCSCNEQRTTRAAGSPDADSSSTSSRGSECS